LYSNALISAFDKISTKNGDADSIDSVNHFYHNSTDDTTYNPKRWLYDPTFCSMVGHSMSHSLIILGLGLGASEMEIKVHYRQLARKYHPDKNDTNLTGLTTTEASDFFKLLNNANEYLKERH
jgi:DnaJ domain